MTHLTHNQIPSPFVSAEEVDEAMEEVLSRPEYTWRLPRHEASDHPDSTGFWTTFWNTIGDWLESAANWLTDIMDRLDHWLRKLFPRNEPLDTPLSLDWQDPVQIFMLILLAITASTLGVLLYRAWIKRNRAGLVQAQPIPSQINLQDDTLTADRLPWQEWMNLADKLLAAGDLRLAMRAMFLASLSALAHTGRLTLARGKSNRDYRIELQRRAHDHPDLIEAFRSNVRSLEQVWYGSHPVTPSLVTAYQENQHLILAGVQAARADRTETSP